jgi:hypothetical protein
VTVTSPADMNSQQLAIARNFDFKKDKPFLNYYQMLASALCWLATIPTGW